MLRARSLCQAVALAAAFGTWLLPPAYGGREKRGFDWDAETRQAVMSYFRSGLAVGIGEEPAELPEALHRDRKTEGVLALFHGERKFAQVEAEGESVADLCEALGREMARALWRASNGGEALEEGVLKADFVLGRERTSRQLEMPSLGGEDVGEVGFVVHERGRALRGESRTAWFPPLDVLRAGRTGNLLEALYTAEGRTPPERWRAEEIRTYALSEASPGGEVFRLQRGGPLLEEFSEDDVRSAFMAGAAWLMASQDASGKFLLDYAPLSGEVGRPVRAAGRDADDEYSMVDHLRAVEPLLRVYEAVEDTRLLEAAERALRHAREQVMTIEAPERAALGEEEEERPRQRAEEICYVGEGRDVARATAIMLAAECRMAEAERRGATGLMRRLGRTLVHMVDEHGHMGFSVRDLMRGDTPHSQDNDVPGRTIYALCRLYELDPREEWLTAATRIGLARLAPQGGRRFRHHPWDIIGLAKLYRVDAPDSHRHFTGEYVRRRPEYVNMAELRQRFSAGAYIHGASLLASSRRDRQWLIDRAQGKPLDRRHETARELRFYWPGLDVPPDYEGGFVRRDGPPEVLHTALRLRALSAVYDVSLIRSEDDRIFRETVRRLALPISRFLVQQQFNAATSFYFPEPEIVEGAFRESPSNYHVRMATTAETVLGLMEALKVLALDDAEPPEARHTRRR